MTETPHLYEFNPIGKWLEHRERIEPYQYGGELSYRLAAGFLDGLPTIEDWGCGCGFAKRYFRKSRYIGVDGTNSQWCDVVDDLRTRRSSPDGLLLRHVLEHNPSWEKVLLNALRSYRQRMVLINFLPFEEKTRLYQDPSNGIPCIAFCRAAFVHRLRGHLVNETVVPETQERVFCIQRIA